MNAREASLDILFQVFNEGHSLNDAMKFPENLPKEEQALVKNLCFGVCRFWPLLQFLTRQCLKKPMKRSDMDIELAIYLGIFQLLYARTPAHAAVSTCVELAKYRKKVWATSLINAVLRSFLRQQEALLAKSTSELTAHYAHPAWMVKQIRQAWPEHWQSILQANNELPPLHARVNLRKNSREDFLERLKQAGISANAAPYCSSAITFTDKLSVEAIPGFRDGCVSIQDLGAQLAAGILNPQPGDRVLDVCAAPGGKTAHLLEYQPRMTKLTAVDIDGERVKKIHDNLARLNLRADVVKADIHAFVHSWTGPLFDRILLDAPCSATGVIRRHPDIKFLRQQDDIPALFQTQIQILETAWTVLKPGGTLLYVTCSILPAENEFVIGTFCQRRTDVSIEVIPGEWGVALPHGRQCLPEADLTDGFYYALLRKTE